MSIPAERLGELRQRGFVNLGPLFDSHELDEIAREYDRLVTFEAQVLGNAEDGVFPYRAMLQFRSDCLRRYVLHPRLVEAASQLLGPDVRVWWDQGINKAPGSGSYIDWHQDNGYERGETAEYFTFWLALDDSDAENGGLFVVPGSHRNGLRPHQMRGAHAVLPASCVEADRGQPLNAEAGDVLLFSSLLVHRTVGNETRDRNRRAWVVQYCRADQRNLETGEIYDNRSWVMRKGQIVDELSSERPFDLRRDRA